MITRLKKNLRLLDQERTCSKVEDELKKGLNVLNRINSPLVSVFGSHITKKSDSNYKHCFNVAYNLGKKGYGMVTGGGPGIMYAANSGARKAGADSVGFRAGLIKNEKVDNKPYNYIRSFDYLFVRRFVLALKSEALLFYPGGYGTLNELFEYVTLVQTGLVDVVPLICINKDYWNGLFSWLKTHSLPHGLIPEKFHDHDMVYIVDDFDEILKLVEDGE